MQNGNIQKGLRSFVERVVPNKAPRHLSKNFKKLDASGLDEIKGSLKRHYFKRSIWEGAITAENYLSSEQGKNDLAEHLLRRLDSFRNVIIPWLNATKPLKGAKILEIGCGTGSSTVALAEQGAKVTAVDIDEDSLAVAKDRCRVYGLKVDFLKANATEASELLKEQVFDFIIFFACLEHMTDQERIVSMKNTWDMLSKDAVWCIIDTPNRLWFFDSHTSELPFYSWLPDKTAFLYSKFSPRQPFCKAYNQYTEEGMLSFLRHGRGVSFHEFDLAMKKADELKVVSSLPLYYRERSLLRKLWWGMKVDSHYESFLIAVGPKIHRGFYQPSLDLIIKKE